MENSNLKLRETMDVNLDLLRLHIRTESYEEALRLSEIMLNNGQNPSAGQRSSAAEEVWLARLTSLWNLGRGREALGDLNSAVSHSLREETARPVEWDRLERDILFEMGEYQKALALCQNYTLKPHHGCSAKQLAGFHHVMALCLMRLGRGDEALKDLETARVLYRQAGEGVGEADVLVALGIQAKNRCVWSLAREHLHSANLLYEKEGQWSRTVHVGLNLAIVCIKSGALAESRPILAMALRRSRRLGDPRVQARLHLTALLLHRRSGAIKAARLSVERAKSLLRGTASPREEALILEFQADLDLDIGESFRALSQLNKAFQCGYEIAPDGDVVCEVHRRRAEAYLALKRPGEAKREAEAAYRLAKRIPDPIEGAASRLLLATAMAALGEGPELPNEAIAEASEALSELRRIGDPFEMGRLELLFAEQLFKTVGWQPGNDSVVVDSYKGLGEIREMLLESRGLLNGIERTDLVSRIHHLLEELWLRYPWRESESSSEDGEKSSPVRLRASGHYRRNRRLGVGAFLTRDMELLSRLEDLEPIAGSDLPILIIGESGTGKELMARAIHKASGRQDGPFVPINCGAVPSELHESEFFGHIRGSFTGASADKTGLFELANGGTVFLDEIGEMEPQAQVKLLRILESGELRRVGETHLRFVNVRIVAATNSNLEEQLESGKFRHDLYFRIMGYLLDLPPLRERQSDILLLAEHFLTSHTDDPMFPPRLSPASRQALLEHPWPGNVRELLHVLERGLVHWKMSGMPELTPKMLGLSVNEDEEFVPPPTTEEVEFPLTVPLDRYLEGAERELILHALEENAWNRTRTAIALGNISRTTLIGKMKRLGLFTDSRRSG